jgi:hypothetical protein
MLILQQIIRSKRKDICAEDRKDIQVLLFKMREEHAEAEARAKKCEVGTWLRKRAR